jgi:hypothetical protein
MAVVMLMQEAAAVMNTRVWLGVMVTAMAMAMAIVLSSKRS